MTRAYFLKLLEKYSINKNIVYFDESVNDGFYIRKNSYNWDVFYKERGKEYECIGFPSESDALQYLFNILYKSFVKKK